MTTEGDLLDLWPPKELQIQKLQEMDVAALYPPLKQTKKPESSAQQAA